MPAYVFGTFKYKQLGQFYHARLLGRLKQPYLHHFIKGDKDQFQQNDVYWLSWFVVWKERETDWIDHLVFMVTIDKMKCPNKKSEKNRENICLLRSKSVFRKVLENTTLKLTFWSHQLAISMVCLCLSPYKMASLINFSVYWRVKNPLFSDISNLSWAIKDDTLFRSISNPPRNPSGCAGTFLGFALILSLETNRVISA